MDDRDEPVDHACDVIGRRRFRQADDRQQRLYQLLRRRAVMDKLAQIARPVGDRLSPGQDILARRVWSKRQFAVVATVGAWTLYLALVVVRLSVLGLSNM